MAGIFEVFVDGDSYFRFRLRAPDGTEMAVSKAFDDKPAVVAGIAAVREYAGMGLVTDLCPAGRTNRSGAAAPAASVRHNSVRHNIGDQRSAADHFRARAKALRRAATGPRWTRAA